MAKKTTTSKDKKSPTKKTAAATTKPKAKTATTKPAAVKSTIAQEPARPTSAPVPVTGASDERRETIRQKVRTLRQSIILSLVILLGLTATLMSGAAQQFRWFFQTSDGLASEKSTVFATGSKLLFDMPYSLALGIVLAIALVYHVLLLTASKKSYERAVTNRIVPHRWLYLGISSALMIEILAMVHGVQDIMVLKLMAGSIFVTTLLGWVVERDNKAHQPSWRVYTISLLTGVLPWLVILGILLGTCLYGGVRLPWYAYALDAVTFFGFSSVALNQFLWIRQTRGWRTYARVEWNYVLGDALTKVGFAVILIAGLMR